MLWVNLTSSPSGLRPGADKGVRATNLLGPYYFGNLVHAAMSSGEPRFSIVF